MYTSFSVTGEENEMTGQQVNIPAWASMEARHIILLVDGSVFTTTATFDSNFCKT